MPSRPIRAGPVARSQDGPKEVTLDQTASTAAGTWQSLGTFEFPAGTEGSVGLSVVVPEDEEKAGRDPERKGNYHR